MVAWTPILNLEHLLKVLWYLRPTIRNITGAEPHYYSSLDPTTGSGAAFRGVTVAAPHYLGGVPVH